ncbi:MAG TPA: hypothetical protein ACFCUY_09400 [Xenococcaceae cyanobacterium]
MHKIFSLKTILTTLISTSLASSLVGLPVRANEANLSPETSNAELILSQNYSTYSDRPNRSQSADDLKNIVGITGLAIGTGVIGWHLTRADKPSLVNSLGTNRNHNASLLDSISPKLRQELLRLVHNRQTANRLLAGTSTSHPGRSANWLAEKVIYDLKRDRY